MIDDEFFQFKFLKGPRFEIFSAMREIYHGQREVALYNLKTDLSDERYQHMDDILLDEGYPYSEFELKDLLDTLKLAQLEDEIYELGEKIKAALNLKQNDDYPAYRDQLNDKRKTYNNIKNRRKKNTTNHS
jgi:hypothetical protein